MQGLSVECEKKTEEAKITTVTPAPLPVRKSMAAASTIAYVMIEKYQMGTPLYRLEKYWNSRGLDLNRNTLARWIILASMWFEPLISSMNRTLMSLDIIHSDETNFNVLKRDGTVTNKLSSMWVIISGKYEKYQIALYNYRRTKSQKKADELLGDYKGTLISDCYPVYGNLKKCTHSACWAHCRRKFLDAVPSGKKEGKAYEALKIIQKMFNEDKKVLDKKSSEKEILKNRQENVKPVLDDFWKHLENIAPVPGSHLEVAVKYAANHKAELCLFADSGKLESTNNRAERAVKPFVMARKKFSFRRYRARSRSKCKNFQPD